MVFGCCFVAVWSAPATAAEFTAPSALQRALAANYELRIEALTPNIAGAEIEAEEGKFLPAFFAEGRFEDNQRSQNSIDFAALQQRMFAEENWTLRSGVGGRLPWGTTYEFSAQLRELDNTVNRAGLPNALFSPEYTAFGGLTLRQPLLKGFGRGANLAGLRVARAQLVIADLAREVAVNNKAVEVLNAFFDLAYAQANVEVKASALAVAERFRGETERRRELGMLGPVDVAEARVRVSEAKEEAILAGDFRRERQLQLVRLLALEADGAGARPTPVVTAVLLDAPPVVALGDFLPAAYERRADHRLAQQRVAQEGTRRTAARNERLPEVDLHFSYGVHGLGPDYGTSVDRARSGDEPQWSAGMSVTVPLSWREGRARSAAANLRVRQAELRETELRERIGLEVENAVRRLDVLGQRLETARSSVAFADEGLRLESARLESGQTSAFAVAELQRRLADARTRELAARVDLTKAVQELWSVSGVLLERHGIEIARTGEAAEATRAERFTVFKPFDLMMRD